jgi:hypothetical protein
MELSYSDAVLGNIFILIGEFRVAKHSRRMSGR